jgi:hypothetical protein
LLGNERRQPQQVFDAEVRTTGRRPHERIRRRYARPCCRQVSKLAPVITKADAVFSPSEVLVYKPELTSVEGVKDMRNQEGLRSIKAIRVQLIALDNGFAERLIGSILRECLDHIVILGEADLYRILRSYARYYNNIGAHRSLDKDAPAVRPVQRAGSIKACPILGGLHHHYLRV